MTEQLHWYITVIEFACNCMTYLWTLNYSNWKQIIQFTAIMMIKIFRAVILYSSFFFAKKQNWTDVVVQLLSHVWLFATPWTATHQASLSFNTFRSLLKLTSIDLVITSNHLILCCPFLLLPSLFPSISIFPLLSSSHQVAKVLELQLQNQSFQWIFRSDFL